MREINKEFVPEFRHPYFRFLELLVIVGEHEQIEGLEKLWMH